MRRPWNHPNQESARRRLSNPAVGRTSANAKPGGGLNVVLSIYLSLIVTIVGGCASTRIPSQPIALKTFELAARNQQSLRLSMQCPNEAPETVLGHQFLLFAIPFGSITFPGRCEYFRARVYQQLALLGIRPLTSSTESFPRELEITLNSVSISAFDLLFTRRVSADISLHFRVRDPEQRLLTEQTLEGHAASFRRFGFEPELLEALETATESALAGVQPLLQEANIAALSSNAGTVPAKVDTW